MLIQIWARTMASQGYNKIIQKQLQLGIIELVSADSGNDKHVIHYLPHHGVVRRNSQTTKLWVAYDGSARATGDEYSLNDCLQKGPNYIPKLFAILIQFRWNYVTITVDIDKAFLMMYSFLIIIILGRQYTDYAQRIGKITTKSYINSNDMHTWNRSRCFSFLVAHATRYTTSDMVHLCFTRLVIGLHSSLAILGAIIEHHLSRYQEMQPDLVKKVENSF